MFFVPWFGFCHRRCVCVCVFFFLACFCAHGLVPAIISTVVRGYRHHQGNAHSLLKLLVKPRPGPRSSDQKKWLVSLAISPAHEPRSVQRPTMRVAHHVAPRVPYMQLLGSHLEPHPSSYLVRTTPSPRPPPPP